MMFLYQILFFIFALCYLPFFIKKGKHRGEWKSRLGFVSKETQEWAQGNKIFWVHAVSVGEVVQAQRFLQAARAHRPLQRFVLTTTTATGREVALRLIGKEDKVLYFPADFKWAVRRFIQSLKPEGVIVLETEIWPNLVCELAKEKIPLFILNARISDKAFNSYKRFKFFFKPILEKIRWIGAQDAVMRERFMVLGAHPSTVEIMGSMKYDWTPQEGRELVIDKLTTIFRNSKALWWVAGSTHPGEEELVLGVYKELKRSFPQLKLLLAPRHPERFKPVEILVKDSKLSFCRVSELPQSLGATEQESPVLILDQMGVLARIYALADVVFVGGSLVARGGHNLVEPAFYSKAILFGPFMQNFSEMAEGFKKEGAAIQVESAEALKEAVRLLLQNSEERKRLGHAAKIFLSQHEGATERSVNRLLALL